MKASVLNNILPNVDYQIMVKAYITWVIILIYCVNQCLIYQS